MKNSAQKITATTQKFTEIEDITENMVILSGGRTCMIMEIMATNFALQSIDEQQIKIMSYASLLNSLSFPIQIVIISRKLDISHYVSLLEEQSKKANTKIFGEHISLYKDFVSQLVQKNTVLDKKFYITISYSFLEKGATGVSSAKNRQAIINDSKNVLSSKIQSIIQELQRVGLKAKILEKNDLIKLFYEIYNQEGSEHISLARNK